MTTITFLCPSCNQALRVGSDHAGKTAKCPRCGTLVTIPPPDEVASCGPRYGNGRPDTPPATITSFAILLLAGAVLFAANLAVPWWRISFGVRSPEELKIMHTGPREAYKKNIKASARVVKDNLDWYRDQFSSRDYARLFDLAGEEQKEQTTFSVVIWGIQTPAGILGLVFACLIAPPVVVAILVAPMRPWVWTSSFVASTFGLVVLIFALTWVFGTPSESAGDVLRQGVVTGPWVGLLSGATVLVAGIVDGIVGVRRLTRRLRRPQASGARDFTTSSC
jgi:hypothetical protein